MPVTGRSSKWQWKWWVLLKQNAGINSCLTSVYVGCCRIWHNREPPPLCYNACAMLSTRLSLLPASSGSSDMHVTPCPLNSIREVCRGIDKDECKMCYWDKELKPDCPSDNYFADKSIIGGLIVNGRHLCGAALCSLFCATFNES